MSRRASSKGKQEVTVETPNLHEVMLAARGFSPRLARELRRDLRQSGDEIISGQRATLDGPLPSGIAHTGYRIKRIRTSGRKAYSRKIRTFTDVDVKRSGSTGLRDKVKSGLKTRVVAGKSRQGVTVRTTGPRLEGYNLAKVWQSRRFRHPVFGGDKWVDQKGQPYFWQPVLEGRKRMRARIDGAIDRTLKQISD